MSWYTGYTKIKEDRDIANKVIAHAESLGLDVGKTVKYRDTFYKIKQLWVNTSGNIHIRVELDHPHLEDFMIELDEIEYGPAIETLFGAKNVST